MTWFASAGDYDPQTLKAALNLAAVVLDSGTDLEDGNDGRLVLPFESCGMASP
jgi:hypothetical protein